MTKTSPRLETSKYADITPLTPVETPVSIITVFPFYYSIIIPVALDVTACD